MRIWKRCLWVMLPSCLMAVLPMPAEALVSDVSTTMFDVALIDHHPLIQPNDHEVIVANRIQRSFMASLQDIQSQQQVNSIGERSLSMSLKKVETIFAAVSADTTVAETALAELQQQLMAETDSLGIELVLLEPSADNLTVAVSSVNDLILSLNRTQLSVVIESPTFMALLHMLGAANKSTNTPSVQATPFLESEVNLVMLTLGP